jgi:hypothetical protein
VPPLDPRGALPRRRRAARRRGPPGGLLDEDGGLALEVFNLEPGAQGLLNALLDGDKVPLQRALSEHYSLDFDLVLGFTAARQLALKAGAASGRSTSSGPALPLELPLKARRLGREEYRVLLERLAGGGAPGPALR